MFYKFFFISFLFFYSCKPIKNKEPKNDVIHQDLLSRDILGKINKDTFLLNEVYFIKKRNINIEKNVFFSECRDNKNKKSSLNYSDTITNTSYFLFEMFGRYKISKINLEINKQLVEGFIKEAGWANENFRQYKLKIEKNSTLEMKNYGLCKCIIIKKADVDNAEQSKFLIIYNKKKSEVSLWDFDNFNFKNGKLVVDFKMKNEHSLYQVDFCEKLDKFYFILK